MLLRCSSRSAYGGLTARRDGDVTLTQLLEYARVVGGTTDGDHVLVVLPGCAEQRGRIANAERRHRAPHSGLGTRLSIGRKHEPGQQVRE